MILFAVAAETEPFSKSRLLVEAIAGLVVAIACYRILLQRSSGSNSEKCLHSDSRPDSKNRSKLCFHFVFYRFLL